MDVLLRLFDEPENRDWTESPIVHMSKERICRGATDER